MLVPNLFGANGVASFVMNYLRNLNHDEVQVEKCFFFRVSKTFLSMLKSVIKFCRMVGMTSSMIIPCIFLFQ